MWAVELCSVFFNFFQPLFEFLDSLQVLHRQSRSNVHWFQIEVYWYLYESPPLAPKPICTGSATSSAARLTVDDVKNPALMFLSLLRVRKDLRPAQP